VEGGTGTCCVLGLSAGRGSRGGGLISYMKVSGILNCFYRLCSGPTLHLC
jgi:hypothetical protein